MKLSIILVAYDMQREIPRSLEALCPSYQLGGDQLDYEVVLVDNGSPTPLAINADDYPGLRLQQLRIDDAPPSPSYAVNAGVKAASGDVICLMIDGAHLLTPGTLQWASRCFAAFDNPVVATRYFYLGPKEQPESIVEGYDQAAEDKLLAKIAWPSDGYKLFEIGTPLRNGANKITWFNRMFESNCLFLRRSLFEEIGGADERFDFPGGGFVNLDIYKQALDAEGATPIQLVGEGSFHQVHGGTTTNSSEEKRQQRLALYREQYKQIRGHSELVSDKVLNFMGHLPTKASKIHLRN
ncbi:glycosyltransferase family 2 protein [Parahaliea sp. F7430]|uniref:Glycosyltransferase family 2 protein n=1 Tax=Sediminihaliea albiluteola TaxID=2758564 RepID=A0A7W2YL10_9GAMM|nr:glycosyltransferase family A protein [Sediminihaliea albiluteola]MBA6414289.1 glycosyltransferase family 2 protein [Sediminihaliea albiluteola]